MRLISPDYLRYVYELDAHTRQLAQKYYEKGAVQYIHIESTDQSFTCFHVEAIVELSGHLNTCSFDLDHGRIQDGVCDCQWCDGWKYCAHLGATAYMVSKMDIHQFPYHFQKTTKKLQEYLIEKDYRQKEQERNALLEKIKKDCEYNSQLLGIRKEEYFESIHSMLDESKYSLIPEFNFEEDHIIVRFKIGNEKMYIIKSISDFIARMESQSTFSYGKFLTVRHDINRFDSLSQKWIQFIKGDPFLEYHGGKELIINEDTISVFYELFHDEILKGIHIKNENLKIQVLIEEVEDVYAVTLKNSFRFNKGKNGYYQIVENTLVYYPIDAMSVFDQWVQKMQETMYLPVNLYSDFIRYVISPYKKHVELLDQRKQIDFDPHYETIRIYGDLFNESKIQFHVQVQDEKGNIQEVLQNDTIKPSYALDVIQSVLEKDAECIKNQIAYYDLNRPETYALIQEGIKKLTKYGEVYVSDALKKLGKKSKYTISIGVRMKNHLLEIDMHSPNFDAKEISEILKAYRKKKRYFKLKNGLMIHLESDELEELDSIMRMYNRKPSDIIDGTLQIENYRALSFNESMDQLKYLQVTNDDSLKTYVDQFYKAKEEILINPRYDSILRSYQKEGVKWLLNLYRYNFNGILADEMGLGKTIQVIAMLDTIKEKAKTSIVVCPASLVYNWEDEIRRFSKSLRCIQVSGTKEERQLKIQSYSDCDVLVTSYDYLRRDIELYKDLSFEYVILDEAQYIKNQKTKNAECVKALKASHRLALSGTPIENTLAELWSIFDFLMPDYLYNYHYFRTEYEVPITLFEDKDAAQQLKKMVGPFILRRIKKDVLKDLPDKFEHQYLLEFSKEESQLYESNLALIHQDMQSKMKQSGFDTIAILSMLTKLRQLCLDPRLLYDNIKKPSTKVQATLDLLKVMKENRKKVLLFSAFTSLLELIQTELDKEGISYYVLTGSTNKESRRQMVHDFNTDETDVFLISLKAGGTGLNLTGAEVIVHIDPWWNVSAQNQATDRAHRIGQNANVQVYQMIMKDSVEEKIVQMQERKARLANSFIEGNEASLFKMSNEEILDLFQR